MDYLGATPEKRMSGGSYFQGGIYYLDTLISSCGNGMIIGLIGGTGAQQQLLGGSGGTGGSGGEVCVESDLSRVHAYNGAYITEVNAIDQTDSWKQTNQSIIYAQVGYSLVDIRSDTKTIQTTGSTVYKLTTSKISSISARTASALIAELGTSYRTIDYSVYTTYGAMGIGSGGGCIEVSNGTLTVE